MLFTLFLNPADEAVVPSEMGQLQSNIVFMRVIVAAVPCTSTAFRIDTPRQVRQQGRSKRCGIEICHLLLLIVSGLFVFESPLLTESQYFCQFVSLSTSTHVVQAARRT